jgi:hypothetical protein
MTVILFAVKEKKRKKRKSEPKWPSNNRKNVEDL